ncbi:KAP family P-loop domain-containing protein [Actinacidiphila alni]|uniref:KAP family P-loop domain-containing protein n=1 Tax=Actinacidiphila alni TaxID=380248 RepID=A0A1I2IX68_9ACTN|nr:P-loop NTPase fold protein [Actinacidiphila alni]SFF47082.1 KAP family P-loop domain-containing protein [Actinacidiphila alni]
MPPASVPPPSPQPALQPFALLNDEPVADETYDLLGANRAAGQLTGLLVASRDATPFTLAVDAGWGMGKSSLMRLVDVRLRRFPEVRTVWYNAWTSTGADALEGLIKSVLAQVDPSILRRAVRRLREGGALVGLLRALTVVAAGPLGVAGMVDELWKRLSVDAGARNGMRDALRDLVGEWTATPDGAPGRLLVVFIDDLDRCSEQTFLAVCEAVKVYLDVPGLAFVIGCDRSAIGPGGLLPDLSPAGAAFVEKIFQTSYRIPAPSAQEIQAYVRSCARLAGIEHLLDGPLTELLAYRAARNPRRVKRLLNGLLLEASLNPVWAGLSPGVVIRTLLLQYLYPDFHRMMTVPAGPGDDGDVVREFLTYRHVRSRLWSSAPLAETDRATVADFLSTHFLPPLTGYPDHGSALADLETRLPVGFPALANDPAFVSLVDELVALPESAVVRRRLREGAAEDEAAPLVGNPVEPPVDSVDYGDTGVSLRPAPTYPAHSGYGYPQRSVSPALDEDEDEFVIDDSPPAWYTQSEPEQSPARTPTRPRPRVVVAGFPRTGGNRLVRSLTADGDDVVRANSPERLAELADGGDLALLICRVDFAEGRANGFDLVRTQRVRGYVGPVIFYSPRITPAERAAARELTAVLTDELDTVLTAARESLTPDGGSAVPNDPPGRPSGGRPR